MFTIFKSLKPKSTDKPNDVMDLIKEIEELEEFTAKDINGKTLTMVYEETVGILIGEDQEGNRYVLATTDNSGRIK